MLYLFYGPDDYSLRRKARQLASEAKAALVFYNEDMDLADVSSLIQASLFGERTCYVFSELAGEYFEEAIISQLAASRNLFIFLEPALDLRTKQAKAWLSDGRIQAENFPWPELSALPDWIAGYIRERGGRMAGSLPGRLLANLGYVLPPGESLSQQAVSLSHLAMELDKLLLYAGEEEVDAGMVDRLVADDHQAVAFAVGDKLAAGLWPEIARVLQRYFSQGTEDEVTKCLALAGLLAEQLRAQLLFQNAKGAGVEDREILAQTGWKPGRLFMLKNKPLLKNAAKLTEALAKLGAFDLEVKNGRVPARVTLEFILRFLL